MLQSCGAEITLEALHEIGSEKWETTVMCGGANPSWPAIGNAVWAGRPLRHVLESFEATPLDDATELQFHAVDGYSSAQPISDYYEATIWLVWEMNGEPLPRDHGFPARFLVANMMGARSVKWPVRLSLGSKHLVDYTETNYPDIVAGGLHHRAKCFFQFP